ncbi:MAG: nucleotidyltransferase family protein [Thermoanaerobaculia bacterium]|nr:nucleotidyltransferase family protein [Thermoanaerobaculia bacterium]
MSLPPDDVSAVLLAAGASTRFGSPKMLVDVEGEPLVRRVARSFVAAGFVEVSVVLAPDARALAAALEGLGVIVAVNPRPGDGMLSSAQAGLSALTSGCGRVAISPADLPGLTAPVLRRLLGGLPPARPGAVAVPTALGRRGHPLVIPAGLVARLLSWGPERRLSDLLHETGVTVDEVPGFGPEVLRDVDVPADLAEALR